MNLLINIQNTRLDTDTQLEMIIDTVHDIIMNQDKEWDFTFTTDKSKVSGSSYFFLKNNKNTDETIDIRVSNHFRKWVADDYDNNNFNLNIILTNDLRAKNVRDDYDLNNLIFDFLETEFKSWN